MNAKSLKSLSSVFLFLGIAGVLFGFSMTVHNLNADYTICILSDNYLSNDPVRMEIPAGDTVKVNVTIEAYGGHYATDGIRLVINDADPKFHVDQLLLEAHYDNFPLQIGVMHSGPSQRSVITIPDNPAYIGRTFSGHIVGNLKYPEWIDVNSNKYKVTTASLNIPVKISVLAKGQQGNGDEHPFLSLPAAITLALLGFLLLIVYASLNKKVKNIRF